MSLHTYSLGWVGAPLRLFIVGVLGLFGMVFLAGTFLYGLAMSPGAFPVWVLLIPCVWYLIVGWNAYWLLWRLTTTVSFDAARLTWSTPLRERAAPLASVRRVRPHHRIFMFPGVVVIEVEGGEEVLLQGRKGLGSWLGELARARPDIQVDGGAWVRAIEALPDWFARPGGDRP